MNSIQGNGSTLHVVGECVNRIGKKDIINRDAKFNRIVNVGSSFPFVECKFIAARYPGVHWDMLDFAENLETEAQTIKTDNVEFFSCYPLDWLRSNDTRRYDIAYFNRVLVLLTNSELRSYLSIIKTIARYIVFCEPACINKFTLPVCLDKIPSHQSIPTYGLMQIHNYRHILREFGFSMVHYDSYETPVEWHGEEHHLVLGVAKNDHPLSNEPD